MADTTPAPDSDPFADLRISYASGELSRASLLPDPLDQFHLWLDEAVSAGVLEPNAMTLSTVSADQQPSARIVLLKGLDASGFYFYTNHQSLKGQELAANPRAALTFHWKPLERQVNVRGVVTRVDRASAEKYFRSRPHESQIGAWVSTQSEKIESREWLKARQAEISQKFPSGHVPLPEFWGGYVLAPDAVEFWQGRPARLHDRFLYEKEEDNRWIISRLSP